MSALTTVADSVYSRWNVIFWLIFGIAAAVFITEVLLGTLTLDIITGLIILATGTYIIGDEIRDRRTRLEMYHIRTRVNELLQWAERMYDYTRTMKEKHEDRLFRLDSRIGNIEQKTGLTPSDTGDIDALAKKMLDIENKLNKIIREQRDRKAIQESYALVKPVRERELQKKPKTTEKEKALTLGDLNPRQSTSIDIIRKRGRITNREYTKTFRVTSKTAYRDLSQMVSAGLLKKHGKGRNTYYTLAF